MTIHQSDASHTREEKIEALLERVFADWARVPSLTQPTPEIRQALSAAFERCLFRRKFRLLRNSPVWGYRDDLTQSLAHTLHKSLSWHRGALGFGLGTAMTVGFDSDLIGRWTGIGGPEMRDAVENFSLLMVNAIEGKPSAAVDRWACAMGVR